MKATLYSIAMLFSAITFSITASGQNAEKLKPGDKMPGADISMKATNGLPVSLKSAMTQNGLLVMFSCNTCPFVIKNQSVTKTTLELAKNANVGVIIINSNEGKRGSDDSYDAMVTYANQQGYKVPYAVDENSKLADLFGANHTPEIFLFDRDGKLVYKGAMNDNPSDPKESKKMFIKEAISEMMAGKPIDPNTTKSVGCSIKRKA